MIPSMIVLPAPHGDDARVEGLSKLTHQVRVVQVMISSLEVFWYVSHLFWFHEFSVFTWSRRSCSFYSTKFNLRHWFVYSHSEVWVKMYGKKVVHQCQSGHGFHLVDCIGWDLFWLWVLFSEEVFLFFLTRLAKTSVFLCYNSFSRRGGKVSVKSNYWFLVSTTFSAAIIYG